MTLLAVLTVLESTLPSLCLSCKIQCQETTVTVLTVLAVSAVVAVSVVTATPLKLNPPFRVILRLGSLHGCATKPQKMLRATVTN